jgi:sugar lactone lactonase YvrE
MGGYEAIEWSPSGRWLYFTDSNAGMRAWRLGDPSAVILPIRPGGTVMSIAAAA